MFKLFTTLATGLALTVAVAGPSKASIIVNWTDMGGNLELSINGTWSDWEATTVMTERDDVRFLANGNTPWAVDISRAGLGTTTVSGAPNGAFALLDVKSGSGDVTGPDATIVPAIGTRYNLEWLNVGGNIAFTAGVIESETFFVNETFNLGAGYTLTAGTRVFGNSDFPGGDTITMNFIPAATEIAEPSMALLVAAGFIGMAVRRRRAR